MSMNDMDRPIENVLAITGKYNDKAMALQKNLSMVAKEEDHAFLREVIQQYIQEAEKMQANLQEVLAKVVELEILQARREQYSEQWWQQKRQVVYKALQNDPQKGLSEWFQTYAEVLIAWELAICMKLISESFPFPRQAVDVLTLFRDGTQAIEAESYLQALEMLMYLTQVTSTRNSQLILDQTSRATLLVFIGRIYLYKASESEAALKLFERAKELVPNDGLPYAALGSYYQAQQDSSQARSLYQRAIELSPKRPDGYIGMGLLAEKRALWDEAADWYEEATEAVQEEKDIELALSKLLAPINGNVYLQLARTLKKKAPEQALRAVELAITTGIKHDGNYPERLGYKLKGEILESLERQVEAAAAYYEAGRRFYWRNEYKIGVDLLTQANKLDSNNISIYWDLSDCLRSSSYLTTPPYADIESINEGLNTWKKGYDLKAPESDYALAYVVRALINDSLARMPDVDRWSLWWEAVVYIERAIILQETNPQYWSYLSRFYRFLETEASALRATGRAIDYDPDNLDALDEHVANLANVGEFDTAEKAIEKRQMLEESVWLKAVEAYILVRKGAYKEACEILQSILKTAPDEIWYHDVQACCYLMLDEPLRARKEYEWIWNKYEPLNTDDLDTFAWAAYNLALFAKDSDSFSSLLKKAIEIYEGLCKKSGATGNVYRCLGLCYLAQGELVRGEELLNEGLVRAVNVRELDDVPKLDLYTIEMCLDSWPHNAQVREVLDRLKGKIREKRAELARLRSVEEELNEVIRKYPREERKINWAWIGAHAGLARFYSEEKRWSEAAKTYLLLQKEGELFPEARIGLAKIFDELQAAGDTHVKEGKAHNALEQLLQISELKLLSDDKARQAQLYSRLGYIHFDLAEINSAREYFARAILLYRDSGSSSPGSSLSEICRALLRNATQYWELDAEWKAMAEESSIDEVLRSELIVARKLLAIYLDEFYKLSERYVDKTELSLDVTPVILEIGDGLIPEDTSQEGPLFKFYIPKMRQRIQDKMGVVMPGIRVRGSNVLPPNGYMILLDEAEIERSSVHLDMRYCPALPETIQALDIPKAALIEKPHPVTGEPGCCVPRDSWELIVSKNPELWAEPLVFIIYHVEAVILKNLTNFMGTQDVENLFAEWEKNQDAAALIVSALPGQRARYHFAQVLRALVREQVPITSWKDILGAFREAGLINVDVSEAVRIIRLLLKEQLPGNNTNAQRLELPSEWEDKFISGLEHHNGRTFLTLPPEETYEFLSTIRNAVKTRDWNLVLVARNSEIRPFVRRLVENEFPHLMVLAQDELVAVDQVVGMEQTKGVVTDAQ